MSDKETEDKFIAGTKLAVAAHVRREQLTDGYVAVSEGGKVVKKAVRDIVFKGEAK